MDCVKVGRLIQTLRKEKRMTQKELAHLMNISETRMSRTEEI